MIKTIRTNFHDKDFQTLVLELDAYLRKEDGEDHAFYSQYNHIDVLNHVVVVYENETPVGCGAVKEYDSGTAEVKRMYVLPSKRGHGVGSIVLKELEQWSAELGYTKCILETGKGLISGIELYKKNGYAEIPRFGQYKDIENSVCFEKVLR